MKLTGVRNRLGRRVAHIGALAVVGIPLVGILGPAAPAASAGTDAAYAFGTQIQAGGQNVVPPTPEAAVATPPGDATKTLINVPASPLAVSGTLTATANAHLQADLPSALTVVTQAVPGPYNARAVGQIENAGVLYQNETPVLSASVIRAEAVAVCSPTPTFSANSEIIDLSIGGNQIPLNAPVQTIIDGITSVLQQSGLNAIVDVHRNVVTDLPGGGKSVDALVVTLLQAAGETPLAEVRLAHAEVTAAACNGGAAPQCSDGVDNDGDGKIDTADPGCHTDGDATNAGSYNPNDNDETDAGKPQCSDGVDNDGDGKIDTADPGCHTDGDATNAATYDANDNDETDAKKPQCSDGVDNDGDAKIDTADPGCHTDGNAANAATYNPNDDDERDAATKVEALAITGGDYSDALLAAAVLTLGLAGFGLRRRLRF